MTPLEAIRIWGLEKLGRYYSSYRAFVLDPKPDDKNIGNILVHIPRVQGGIKIIARAKSFYGGPGFGYKYFQPHRGEIVWIEFENGNPSKPLWSYHTWAEEECPEELRDINTAGLVTANGNKILIEETNDGSTIKVSINEGSTFMLKDNTVTIEAEKVSVDTTKAENGIILFNQGKKGGVVNISALRDLITAIQTDLAVAGSGTQVASFITTHLVDLVDTKVKH